jgi:basic membrane protein A
MSDSHDHDQKTKPSSSALNRREFLYGSATAAAVAGAVAATGFPRLAKAAEGELIALVNTQAAGDNGPVDSMIAALKKLAEERGSKQRAVYASDPATYESILKSLGEAKATVVLTTFNEMAEPIKAVAPSFPDTKFIQLFGDPMEPAIPNAVTVSYDYYLGCYLSGMFAARYSETGKLGYIGGISIPPLNADFNAMKAGAMSVNDKVTVTSAFAGSFQDPAKGHEIASQMYQSGIDYIQTDSAATDTGIIQAANEGKNKFVSALDPAQYKLGPKTVMAIVQLDFGGSLRREALNALGPEWKGGSHVHTDLSSGVIDFKLSDVFLKEGDPKFVEKAKAIWPDIEKARAAIIDGSLKVPFNTVL